MLKASNFYCSPIRTLLYCTDLWTSFVPLFVSTSLPRRQVHSPCYCYLFFLFSIWLILIFIDFSIDEFSVSLTCLIWCFRYSYQGKWCYNCITFCMPCWEMTGTVTFIIGEDRFSLLPSNLPLPFCSIILWTILIFFWGQIICMTDY